MEQFFELFIHFQIMTLNVLQVFIAKFGSLKIKIRNCRPRDLNFLVTLQKQNQKRIFEEKQKLIAQLAALDELNSSSPFRDSAESI